jgi:hypothetical protein
MGQTSQAVNGAKITINSPEQAEAALKAQTAKTKKTNGPVTCTDTKGRVITVAEPNFLSQFRLVEALGDSANNVAYMNLVRPLLYVKAIDEEPVSTPVTKREVEALIQRLGSEGYNALAEVLLEKFIKTNEDNQITQEDKLKK